MEFHNSGARVKVAGDDKEEGEGDDENDDDEEEAEEEKEEEDEMFPSLIAVSKRNEENGRTVALENEEELGGATRTRPRAAAGL
jgi:hypothetical protein